MGKREKRSRNSSDTESEPKSKRIEANEDDDLFDDMDEEDRERLNQMSEKDRELEIFKRIEQRERDKMRKKLQEQLAQGKKGEDVSQKKEKSSSDEDSAEESAEEEEAAAVIDTAYHKPSDLADKQNKQKAMTDLLKKRQDKKQAEEKRKKDAEKAALDIDEIFGGDDGKSSSSSSSSSRSSSPISSRSRSPSPAVPKQLIQSKAELMRCRLSRFKLAEFVHAPFFTKMVIGCFVRIGIGQHQGRSVYRVAQIVDVVETGKIYTVEGKRTNKGIKLKHGPDQRVYRLEFVSNQEFSDSEFQMWMTAMKNSNSPLPTVDFVDQKYKDIQTALDYKYTDAEINQIVKEKSRFNNVPTNFALKKGELLKAKEYAEQAGQTLRAIELQQQITELDVQAERLNRQRTQQLSAISVINQKNRDLMKQAFLSDAGASRDDLNSSQDDPFTRKSGRMKMVSGSSKFKAEKP